MTMMTRHLYGRHVLRFVCACVRVCACRVRTLLATCVAVVFAANGGGGGKIAYTRGVTIPFCCVCRV